MTVFTKELHQKDSIKASNLTQTSSYVCVPLCLILANFVIDIHFFKDPYIQNME